MGSKRNSKSTVATDFAKFLYTYSYSDSDSDSNSNAYSYSDSNADSYSNPCGTDQPDRYRSIVESDPAVVD